MNFAAVDAAIEGIQEVKYPTKATSKTKRPPMVPTFAPEFVKIGDRRDHRRTRR